MKKFLLGLMVIFFTNSLAQADTLGNIKKSKQLMVGVSYDNEPFSFLNRNKKLIGFDIELIKLIAKNLNVKIKFIEMKSKRQIINSIIGEKIDIVTSMLHNNKSDKYIDFSITYFYDGQSILSKNKTNKTSYKEFDGSKIGSVEDSIAGKVFEIVQPLAELRYYTNINQLKKALINNEVDAITANYSILSLHAKKSNGKLITIGKPFTLEPVAFGIKENESNFRDLLNVIIQDIVKSGEYATLYEQWFRQKPKRKPILWP